MNFRAHDWRDRRNFLNQGVAFGPLQYTISNYSTEAQINKKSDLESFDKDILTKISSIPDPLKKNLADTVITTGNNKEKVKMPPERKEFYYNDTLPTDKEESSKHRSDFYPTIMGITSFISNFFGAISGAMFHRRPKSPASQYYDCFDSVSDMEHQMAAECWQEASSGDQNKNKAHERISTGPNDNMNNCRAAVAQCEDKLNSVRSLLINKTVPIKPKFRSRRPRRVFVEPGSIEDSYEEEFVADDYVSLSNDEYVEYFAIPNANNQSFSEIEAPKMKTEYLAKPESTDIVKIMPEVPIKLENSTVIDATVPEIDTKKEIITSCEDKMAKLKSLLLEKRQKPTKNSLNDSTDSIMELVKDKPPKTPSRIIPIEKKQDKRFKNPNRLVEKRTRAKLRKNIQDDMVFAHEIDSDDISSVDNSPVLTATLQRISETPIGSVESVDYFDELKGKFHSASTTDSEDSFQIVFSDLPKPSRVWRPSDCDSEDSFIVFEDSPDNCFTSNEVFCNNDAESLDSDSELSDSGCAVDVCKLSHSFSRTIGDLTDNSLYEDTKTVDLEPTIPECADEATTGDETTEPCVTENDEVDCVVRAFEELVSTDVNSESVKKPGLLIDEAKKLQRKNLPAKKVTFSEEKPKVHVMRVWAFAARQARAGHWERHALDRERFKRRIADVDMAVSWVLKPQHRSRIMFQRIMPWRNQQRRKEAAEKKEREEEEKRIEAERLQKEQERLEAERIQKELEEEERIKEQVREKEKKEAEVKNKLEVIQKLKEFRKSVRKVENDKRDRKNNLVKSQIALKESINEVVVKLNKEKVEFNDKLTDLNFDIGVKKDVKT